LLSTFTKPFVDLSNPSKLYGLYCADTVSHPLDLLPPTSERPPRWMSPNVTDSKDKHGGEVPNGIDNNENIGSSPDEGLTSVSTDPDLLDLPPLVAEINSPDDPDQIGGSAGTSSMSPSYGVVVYNMKKKPVKPGFSYDCSNCPSEGLVSLNAQDHIQQINSHHNVSTPPPGIFGVVDPIGPNTQCYDNSFSSPALMDQLLMAYGEFNTAATTAHTHPLNCVDEIMVAYKPSNATPLVVQNDPTHITFAHSVQD